MRPSLATHAAVSSVALSLGLSLAIAPREARASVRCEPMGPASAAVFSLAPGEQLGRLALARGPDDALWIAARVLPHRFARRPRTRVLAGAWDARAGQWAVAPVEVASLPGRAELPLAIAPFAQGALVLAARPRAVLVRSIARDTGALSPSVEWPAPRLASGPPLVDAQGSAFVALFRGPARLSVIAGAAESSSAETRAWTHVPRRGSLSGDGLSAVVALSATRVGVVHALRTGALRLAVIEGTSVSARHSQPAHCPDRCEMIETRAISTGAIAVFSMKVHGERTLARYWASRVSTEGSSHTDATLPVRRATAAPGGVRRDPMIQVARPLVLRAIARPVAIPMAAGATDIARAVATLGERDESFTVASAHAAGLVSIARARCTNER